jgi:hypothetical protein
MLVGVRPASPEETMTAATTPTALEIIQPRVNMRDTLHAEQP